MIVKKVSRKGLIITAILLLLMLLFAGLAYGSWRWYSDQLKPASTTSTRVRVIIESGTDSKQIADLLKEKGVIKNSAVFQFYVKRHGDRDKLRAGNYLFSPTQTVAEIVDWLVSGKVDTFNVTIYPGKTLAEIKQHLVRDGFKPEAIDAAFAKNYNHPLFESKPVGTTLEGYIYPETYQVTSDTTVEQLLTKTFDEFYKQIQEKNLAQQLAAKGFNLYQGLTLASIVEREVPTDSDQRQVAQVFEKRLNENIALGADSTFYYAAKILGVEPKPSLDSPYNTRIHKGLPPGPIANVVMPALEAVANPAPGDYLYFVSGDDGVTHFAHTQAEQDANTQKYCTKLCAS